MLKYIEFKADRFTKEDYYNIIEFTENTIILCNSYNLMDTLATEIINTVNKKAEYNDYWCDDKDDGKAKLDLCFGLQRVIDINGQKISIGLEPAIIYKANKLEDIWLFDYRGCDKIETLPKYEEFIYPMLIFKGSKKHGKMEKMQYIRQYAMADMGAMMQNGLIYKEHHMKRLIIVMVNTS